MVALPGAIDKNQVLAASALFYLRNFGRILVVFVAFFGAIVSAPETCFLHSILLFYHHIRVDGDIS